MTLARTSWLGPHSPQGSLFRSRSWQVALALASSALAPGLHAQVIDDLELRREGPNAVLTVRMAMPIQFRRAVSTAADDLVQIYYDVLPGRSRPSFIEGERKTLGGNGLPRIIVTEDGLRAELVDRKLVVRLDRGAKMKVKPGRDSQSLDIQLEGLGAALDSPAGGSPAAAASRPAAGLPPGLAGQDVLDQRGLALLNQARAALQKADTQLALEALNEALNLPPNASTAAAQALIGQVRLARGDVAGARQELSLYLESYPQGAEAETVRLMLAGLADAKSSAPAPMPEADAAQAPRRAGSSSLTGAWSQTYYGGNSRTLTQLKDTPLEGQIPQVISESTLAGTDQKQLVSMVDLNWRSRDAERELRGVVRDSYTADGMPNRSNQNRLSALYLDWRETAPGLTARVGRQSGLGGGVLGRFDGAQAGWRFAPKWKVSAVAGKPTDKLLDTQRQFSGISLETEAFAAGLAASTYAIQQTIDGEIDRRAVGMDVRYFNSQASVFSQFEYDTVLKGLNVASVQGTYTRADNTTINVLLDRRATPMLMLGNALFFADPSLPTLPRTLPELLALRPIGDVRALVASTTAYATQGLLGVTTPVNSQWQVGADFRLTNVGAIAPVPGLLPTGLPGTGNLWSVGLQAIGTNLYSSRDTHVFNLTLLQGPGYSGWLAAYNNLSVPQERWQLEPSLRLYSQSGPNGLDTQRWAPGLRLTWRGGPKWVVEGDASVETSNTKGATQNEQATRAYYSLGYRLEL